MMIESNIVRRPFSEQLYRLFSAVTVTVRFVGALCDLATVQLVSRASMFQMRAWESNQWTWFEEFHLEPDGVENASKLDESKG